MMETKFYNDSLKDGTIGRSLLFYETEPPRHCPGGIGLACKALNLAGGNDNTFVNTVKVGDHLLSLTDSPFGVEIDPITLGVVGKFVWEDKLGGLSIPYSSSAHPLRHPETGRVVDYLGTENLITGQANMKVFEIDHAQPKMRKSVVDVPDGTPPYMHSFGLTDKYVVLPHMPVKFDFLAVVEKSSMVAAFKELHPKGVSPDNAFHIRRLDAETCRLLVPPCSLESTKPIVQMLPVDDRLYYTHTVNTFENASGIVIDLTVTSANPFTGNLSIAHALDKTSRDTDSARLAVRRFLLPLNTDTNITSEYLSDPTMSTDFTKMNTHYMGKEHCFFWAVQWFSDHKAFASMSVVKHQICGERKTLAWHRPNWYPSEATFLPSSNPNAAEDEGLVVFTALDGANKQSHLVVLDGKTMQPVSEVGPFPPIGFTTHGEFYKAVHSKAAKGVYV